MSLGTITGRGDFSVKKTSSTSRPSILREAGTCQTATHPVRQPPTNIWSRKMHCKYRVTASMESRFMRDARFVGDLLGNAKPDIDEGVIGWIDRAELGMESRGWR